MTDASGVQGRRGSGEVLYFRECFNCLEFSDGNNSVEFLCIKTRGKTNKADVKRGGCYRPPKQDEEAEETFYFY